MKVYRVDNFGWALLGKDALPDTITGMHPALVLGTKDSARAGVFHVNGEYVILATLVGDDTTALVVSDFPHLLRLLSDLSAVIGGDLATRMHTDLQAQIEDANEQVMEVVKERNERKSTTKSTGKSKSASPFLGRAHD